MLDMKPHSNSMVFLYKTRTILIHTQVKSIQQAIGKGSSRLLCYFAIVESSSPFTVFPQAILFVYFDV